MKKMSLFFATFVALILASCNKGEIARLEKEKAIITATKDSLKSELSNVSESLFSANERIENDSVIAKTGLSMFDFSGTDIEPHFNSEDLNMVQNPDGLASVCTWIPYLFGKESNFLRNELEKPEVLSKLFNKNKRLIPIVLWATGTEEKAQMFARRLLPYCAGIAPTEKVQIFNDIYTHYGNLDLDSLRGVPEWPQMRTQLGYENSDFDFMQEYKSFLFAKRRMEAGGQELMNVISEILIYIINGESSQELAIATPEVEQHQSVADESAPADKPKQPKTKVARRE